MASMYSCHICEKPFKQQSSRNRHLEYCRRGQDRPRIRTPSCRACSVAKTKCTSSQSSCARCVRRGIECIFEPRPARRRLNAQLPAADTFTTTETTPNTISDQQYDDNAISLAADFGQLAEDLIWDIQSNATGFLPMDPSITASTSEQASASLIATAPVVADSLEFMMGLHSCGEDPPALLAAVSVPPKTSPLADAGFLTCLPITDPVAQRNATYLIQLLRPFPQMMVRRAAFPPFIHPNWHRGDGADAHKTLPEPISHCISIAQMFSLRTPDTRTFVWNTVRTEQRRLMDQCESFNQEDLLGAIQSWIIYIIMRVVDDAANHAEHDLHMLLCFTRLCTRFRRLCQGPFSHPEQTHPNGTWPNWVYAESRRRVACIWFLIGQVVSTKTGIPCDTSEEYHCLPLPGGRSLWESRTREEWETEYSATQTTVPGRQLTYFGDLIEVQKMGNDPSMVQKLDAWNAKADTLGFMLTLATAMV